MAIAQMRTMGITDVGNMTILVEDGRAAGDPLPTDETPNPGRTGAQTYPELRIPPVDADGDDVADALTPANTLPRECMVSFFTLAAQNNEPVWVQSATAHEIFHCIQFELVPAQMAARTGGAWWVEGSAELFAALSVPNSQPYNSRTVQFDGAVRNFTPIYDMEYGAAVFFHWWASTNDASSLIGFLGQMATSNDDGAQRAAMRGASSLSDERWLNFAQSYVDGTIPHPQGGNLPTSPSPKGPIKPYRNGDHDFQFRPFVLHHVTIDFECGLWEVDLQRDDINISIAPRDGDWINWPDDDEFDARDGQEPWHDLVVINTTDGNQDVEAQFERTAVCTPCAGETAVDACLAGTWEMAGGGPVEWMRAQGLPLTNVTEGPRHVQWFSDGLYRAGALDMYLRMNFEGDDWGEAEGASLEAVGTWSADKETEEMAFCQMGGGVNGTVTVHSDGQSYTVPVAQAGAAEVSMTYKCSVDSGTLTTQMEIPGMPSMSTTYTRIAEEPDGVVSP